MSNVHPSTNIKDKAHWYSDLLLLFLGLFFSFSLFLGSHPLGNPDEGRYAEIPREMLATHNYITPYLNGVKYFEKPALFYWIQAAAIKTLGFSEWAVRTPNALLALLGCLFVYAAGRLLYDRRTGILSAIILATSLLYFGMAHIVTIDMVFSVLCSASLFSFLIATQRKNHKKIFYYSAYIFAALAMLAKGLVGLLFPAMIIGIWILLLNEWRIIKEMCLPTGLLLFLIIALPWHILVQQRNPEFFQFYFIDQHFLRFLTKYAGRNKPAWFFIPVLIAGFLPWISFLPQAIYWHLPKSWAMRQQNKTALFLILWSALIFIFFSVSHSKLVPYLLPVFPALAILVGNFIANHWQKSKQSRSLTYGYTLLPIIISILCIGLIIAVRIKNPFISNAKAIMPYIIGITIIWITGALLAAIGYWKNKQKLAVSAIAISTIIAYWLMLSSLIFANLGSIKPLAQILKPLLKPNTIVACYENYYQDLPYYLKRRVTIVDWRGELAFGMKYEDTQAWMINNQQFWKAWQSNQLIYMITNQKTYKKLQNTTSYKLYLIGQTSQDVLISNQRLLNK